MALRVVYAPENYLPSTRPRIFLAGGITGCPDWQTVFAGRLNDLCPPTTVILNPRRPNFDVKQPNVAFEQISWEFNALRDADIISFWFPAETLCPIVLYELGAWSMNPKRIFVGCHPNYQRRFDVTLQTNLARPEVAVVSDLDLLARLVAEEARQRSG